MSSVKIITKGSQSGKRRNTDFAEKSSAGKVDKNQLNRHSNLEQFVGHFLSICAFNVNSKVHGPDLWCLWQLPCTELQV